MKATTIAEARCSRSGGRSGEVQRAWNSSVRRGTAAGKDSQARAGFGAKSSRAAILPRPHHDTGCPMDGRRRRRRRPAAWGVVEEVLGRARKRLKGGSGHRVEDGGVSRTFARARPAQLASRTQAGT